ncbi:WhiB family transcriptional regulator [Streptomyces sp. PTM05]|uniref:Transcriptional regulator WhiB n=1 Tax=Streptantibioticus parmotrematis TaxID=2873249 RepID=A0ABS7QUZ4_9ACTN|nr:WhiB family transcriptional regulator [Streptantibioticus parmotrematis]MBY8887038.1 WhiB family transcriptional regulator [Streptantibioticus parmotrematis]
MSDRTTPSPSNSAQTRHRIPFGSPPYRLPRGALPACQGEDPELFFPSAGYEKRQEQVARAKRICARCLCNRDCLRLALHNDEPVGIWGGCTTTERRVLRNDIRSLRREPHPALRSLERGETVPVDPFDLLGVVHRLTVRGLTMPWLCKVLNLTPETVLRLQIRGARAAALVESEQREAREAT